MTGQYMILVHGALVPGHRCCGRTLSDGHREGCRMVVGKKLLHGPPQIVDVDGKLYVDLRGMEEHVCKGCGYHVCSCQTSSAWVWRDGEEPRWVESAPAPHLKWEEGVYENTNNLSADPSLWSTAEPEPEPKGSKAELVGVNLLTPDTKKMIDEAADKFFGLELDKPEPPTFKPGDRVRCVLEGAAWLTKGRVYEVLDPSIFQDTLLSSEVVVYDDDGDPQPYLAQCFVHADAEPDVHHIVIPAHKREDVLRALDAMGPGTIERIEPEGADREGWRYERGAESYLFGQNRWQHCFREHNPRGGRFAYRAGKSAEVQYAPTLLEAQKAVERAVREAEKPAVCGVSPAAHDWDSASSTCKQCGAHWRDINVES